MRKSLAQLKKALELSESGQHAAVVAYLGEFPSEEIEQSPTLALLLGSARARLGQIDEGQRQVDLALASSQKRGDRNVEFRALNARGAIALMRGQVDEAEQFFTRSLNAAKREGDDATVGRCSNNLGIIEHYRGQYGRALSSYNIALAAFQQAGLKHGLAEVEHNMGITYRDQRFLPRAREQAERAVRAAKEVGDGTLSASTLAIQAEAWVLSGDVELARRQIDEALAVHRELGDELEITDDLLILARVVAAEGNAEEGERLLREVIERADREKRPRMVAVGHRDLAHLLASVNRADEATDAARTARVTYSDFGAVGEIQKLDDFIESLCYVAR